MANINLQGVEPYFDARTNENWMAVTRTIPKGFPCVEIIGDGKLRLKIGDGTRTYASLPYIGGELDENAVKQLIQEEIAKLGKVFRMKGRVESTEELPSEDNKEGDVYLVGAESDTDLKEYYWTGTLWDYMGTTMVDLSNYYTKSETDALLEAKYNKTEGEALSTKVTSLEETAVRATDKLLLSCTLGDSDA